eukprot:TRINITY_DN157832_c0_g1_i1.p1 TRINITY_DN157832_c0_g1~~TRINITY_DN157832_c0_g1_i1.p1  ORF type:complete len:357 (+),score=43.35 TRINITY_DN157832_c0_g1_i1:85-1155(+)
MKQLLACAVLVHLVCFFPFGSRAHSEIEVGLKLSSGDLVNAFNAALMEVWRDGTLDDLDKKWSLADHHVKVWTCNPYAVWPFPIEKTLADNSMLRDVLTTGRLIVVGYEADWGKDGNYKLKKPTGYWPDMLDAVVRKISANYSQKIKVYRQYTNQYASGMLMNGSMKAAVGPQHKRVHMSEPYFLLAGLTNNKLPKKNSRFYSSCSALAGKNVFLVSSRGGSLLHTLDDILGLEEAFTLGALSNANVEAVAASLTSKIRIELYTDEVHLANAIREGEAKVGVTSGILSTDNMVGLTAIDAGSVSMHAAFFRRDDDLEFCQGHFSEFTRGKAERKTGSAVHRCCGATIFLAFIYIVL